MNGDYFCIYIADIVAIALSHVADIILSDVHCCSVIFVDRTCAAV